MTDDDAVTTNDGDGVVVTEEPPRLTRMAPFTLERAGDDSDGLTLYGYAAVFNSPTEIDSWEGRFTEVIAPGAFKRTINAQRPVVQFDHGQHPFFGSLPIAAVRKLREDSRGLYIEAQVFDTWFTEPLRAAIREQAVNGMSFRFSVVRDAWSSDKSTRTLHEVKLYELGPVVFPAYADTSVALRSLERATGLTILRTDDAPAAPSTAPSPASTDPAPSHSARTKNQRLALAGPYLPKEKP